MEIEVEIRSVYGKPAIYPINDIAIIFAELVGQKTLTQRDLGLIKQLGYAVKLSHGSVSELLAAI